MSDLKITKEFKENETINTCYNDLVLGKHNLIYNIMGDIDIVKLNQRIISFCLLDTNVSIFDNQITTDETLSLTPNNRKQYPIIDCFIFDIKNNKKILSITEEYIKQTTIVKLLPLNPLNIGTAQKSILGYNVAMVSSSEIIKNPEDDNKLVLDIPTIMDDRFYNSFMDYVNDVHAIRRVG